MLEERVAALEEAVRQLRDTQLPGIVGHLKDNGFEPPWEQSIEPEDAWYQKISHHDLARLGLNRDDEGHIYRVSSEDGHERREVIDPTDGRLDEFRPTQLDWDRMENAGWSRDDDTGEIVDPDGRHFREDDEQLDNWRTNRHVRSGPATGRTNRVGVAAGSRDDALVPQPPDLYGRGTGGPRSRFNAPLGNADAMATTTQRDPLAVDLETAAAREQARERGERPNLPPQVPDRTRYATTEGQATAGDAVISGTAQRRTTGFEPPRFTDPAERADADRLGADYPTDQQNQRARERWNQDAEGNPVGNADTQANRPAEGAYDPDGTQRREEDWARRQDATSWEQPAEADRQREREEAARRVERAQQEQADKVDTKRKR